ncbi:MAG: hypothetical protein QM726_08885 [Chitinophagaceae bacterium]
MKAILVSIAVFAFTSLLAQNNQIYGKFTKSDGAVIKGSSTKKGYENQLIITGYTGGSDNSAVIEIETPINTYVAEFRNAMNAANTATAAKPVLVASPSNVATASAAKANLGERATQTMTLPVQKQATIARAEITVALTNPEAFLKPATKIILEEIKVESCTDNAATGTTKIRLRGSRIGWLYYSYPAGGGQGTATKSGWDVVANKAWTGF